MSIPLSASAQKVQNAIFGYGYQFTVIEFDKPTRTSQEAADVAGCSLGQIVKSLVFQGANSGKPLLVLVSGVNRVNEKIVSMHAGEIIQRATPDFVRSVTGFAIGGIPPFSPTNPLETFIDEDLMGYATIWGAAGTPNAIFEFTPAALVKMSQGKIIQIK
jgi:prolyl-tRNA editing enzyme YbaK/EbsC (Cys-tRNA(Pro) deacylase)